MKKISWGKLISNAFSILMIAGLLWVFISFLEISWNNLTPNYEYSSINFFTKMMEWSGR